MLFDTLVLSIHRSFGLQTCGINRISSLSLYGSHILLTFGKFENLLKQTLIELETGTEKNRRQSIEEEQWCMDQWWRNVYIYCLDFLITWKLQIQMKKKPTMITGRCFSFDWASSFFFRRLILFADLLILNWWQKKTRIDRESATKKRKKVNTNENRSDFVFFSSCLPTMTVRRWAKQSQAKDET